MHRLSDASIDEDLLFASDSDDSFTKEYNIPKKTLRKERILKKDKSRFEKEKIKREEKRVRKLQDEAAHKLLAE